MKTKATGILILFIAIAKTIVDGLDGGGFSMASHYSEIYAGLGAAGLIFLRIAIDKLQKLIEAVTGYSLSDPKMDQK